MGAAPNPVDWAAIYATAGWRLFPVRAGDKKPQYPNWQADATTDQEQIERYWYPDSGRNMGVVAGEAFDAWDIEAAHLERFGAWLTADGRALPETPIASTGRGGIHVLTAPTGIGHTRKLYLGDTHIGELKSTGGFIVICPSKTTGYYRWLVGTPRLAVAPAPGWLLALVREPAAPRKGPAWPQVSLSPTTDIQPLVRAIRDAQGGERNNILHWAANRAYDDGIPYGLAEQELLAAFIAASLPSESPFERGHEGRATIASAYNR